MILPCYNPSGDWTSTVINSIKTIEDKSSIEIDLILVNDGSTKNVSKADFDALKAELPQIEIIDYSVNRGKGYALRQGVKQAKTDLIIYTDIDFPYTVESFLSVYEGLTTGLDVVPGHRGEGYYENTPYFRKLISKFLRWNLKVFLNLPTDDTQCGIKGFNKRGSAVFLDTQIDRFLFDLEFIKLAAKRKLSIKIARVELKPGVVFSKVNIKILAREAVNFFKVLFRK